jgi:hypothetical protein
MPVLATRSWDPGHNKDGGEILSDLWRLDLASYQWRKLTPQARFCFSHLLSSIPVKTSWAAHGGQATLLLKAWCCHRQC